MPDPPGRDPDYKYIEWLRDHPPEEDLTLYSCSKEKLSARGYGGRCRLCRRRLTGVDVRLNRAIRHLATILVDASRAKDEPGVKVALKAIYDVVNRHREAVESIEREQP